MTEDEAVKYWSDWLVDAVATSTQNRMFLRGDPESDDIACESILMNGAHAIRQAFKAISE